MPEPETLIDAVRYYADRKTCFETMLSVKWPAGKIVCPKCHGELIGKIESRSILQCKLERYGVGEEGSGEGEAVYSCATWQVQWHAYDHVATTTKAQAVTF